MSTELTPGAGTPGEATPPVQSGTPTPEIRHDDGSAELERLRAENARYAAVMERLDPYAEDIQRYISDDQYRGYVQQGRKLYDEMEQRKPVSYSPEMQALRDEVVGLIEPFKNQFEHTQQAQQVEYNAKKQRVFDDGKPIVMNYLDKHPEIRNNPSFAKIFAQNIDALQEEAVNSGRPFKEVWDNYMLAYGGERETRQAPPRQLRANSGEPGIPAAPRDNTSHRRADGSLKSTAEAFMDTFRRVGRAS